MCNIASYHVMVEGDCDGGGDGDGEGDGDSGRDSDDGVAKETETIIHVQYMCSYSR